MQDVTLTNMGEAIFSGRRVAVEHNDICYQMSMFHVGGEPLSEIEQQTLNDILTSFRFNR